MYQLLNNLLLHLLPRAIFLVGLYILLYCTSFIVAAVAAAVRDTDQVITFGHTAANVQIRSLRTMKADLSLVVVCLATLAKHVHGFAVGGIGRTTQSTLTRSAHVSSRSQVLSRAAVPAGHGLSMAADGDGPMGYLKKFKAGWGESIPARDPGELPPSPSGINEKSKPVQVGCVCVFAWIECRRACGSFVLWRIGSGIAACVVCDHLDYTRESRCFGCWAFVACWLEVCLEQRALVSFHLPS